MHFAEVGEMAIYGPYGHFQLQYQYARYWYLGTEGINTTLTMLILAQSDIPLKSYGCFKILGQICPLIKAIFDQFYQHRKELSYSL